MLALLVCACVLGNIFRKEGGRPLEISVWFRVEVWGEETVLAEQPLIVECSPSITQPQILELFHHQRFSIPLQYGR